MRAALPALRQYHLAFWLLCVVSCQHSEICWDKFDMNYRNQCLNGMWEPRFYFDHASLTCRQFWFDGCRSDSRNMFEDILTCQWLCEEQPMYKSKSCLEDFDAHYKDQCNGGRWRQQWYFERATKRCVPFWYDGCTGQSQNIFQDEQSCLVTCENPTKDDPRKPWHRGDKQKMREKLEPAFKPNMTNICETASPCKNGGSCHFSYKKNTYYCTCPKQWTGTNCTEKIDFDPCSSNPCQNGATCNAKTEKGKTVFECFCPVGYGGPMCSEKPCDSSPCMNNGTCRATRGHSKYFCNCPPQFGGQNCDIVIGSTPPETYGSAVEKVSSGKAEWVAEMKARLAKKEGKKEEEQVADEPYKDPKQKKREREEKQKREKEENDKREMEIEEKRKQEEEARLLEEELKRNETMLLNEAPSNFMHLFATAIMLGVIRFAFQYSLL